MRAPLSRIRLYPRPYDGWENAAGAVRVYFTLTQCMAPTLDQTLGSRVLRANDAKTIDLRGLAEGTYILTLTDQQAVVITHQRVDKTIE
jgi:hypothetical protein